MARPKQVRVRYSGPSEFNLPEVLNVNPNKGPLLENGAEYVIDETLANKLGIGQEGSHWSVAPGRRRAADEPVPAEGQEEKP